MKSFLLTLLLTSNSYDGGVQAFLQPSFLLQKSQSPLTKYFASTEDGKEGSGSKAALESLKDIKLPTSESFDFNAESISERILSEGQEALECVTLAFQYITQDETKVKAEDIVRICDDIDDQRAKYESVTSSMLTMDSIQLRIQALELGRYHLLTKLLKNDYEAYVATAGFLSPSRISRLDLPNVQDVPFNEIMPSRSSESDYRDSLVDDCTLEDMKFEESPLDKLLLNIFRGLVEKNGNVSSSKPGIDGLLEQGRLFMLKPNQTQEAQHKMVSDTLGGLMTPVLPPFYRIFMAGIVPKLGTEWDGKQIGPWFYAPWLTTIVTPTFFGFLVGPSRPNRRKDGERGGLVVEKCKFLQESGCKGLCLHQCKLPAQSFFKDELGLELTVSPNFATQECQWSFGEVCYYYDLLLRLFLHWAIISPFFSFVPFVDTSTARRRPLFS